MSDQKRRLVGPYGAVFVANNVDDETIKGKIKSGEWSELPKPEPKRRTKAQESED